MKKSQRAIIAFFTFIGGAYFFLEFILPKSIGTFTFGAFHEQILKGIQVVGIMAIGLGIISIVRVHSRNITAQKKGWINSVVLLAGFFLMIFFQAVVLKEERSASAIRKRLDIAKKFVAVIEEEKTTKPPLLRLQALGVEIENLKKEFQITAGESAEVVVLFQAVQDNITRLSQGYSQNSPLVQNTELIAALGTLNEAASAKLEESQANTFFKRAQNLVNNGLFVPLGSAMFALLAFYIANAAFRSFRVRSFESFLLMSAAVIVMLGQIPQGTIYISESLPSIRLWLLKNVSTPAFRAIFFGSAIAGLAMALRIWFSLERGPLDQDEHGGVE